MNKYDSAGRPAGRKRPFLDWTPLAVSLAALVVSVLLLYYTHRSNVIAEKANSIAEQASRKADMANHLAMEANLIAREQLATSQESHVPHLETWYYSASSLDFQDPHGTMSFSFMGLRPRPVKTKFWHAEYDRYQEGSGQWYLFIIIGNRGGTAHGIKLSEMRWFAKSGAEEPPLWSEMRDLGMLEKGQAYALLVDTMESYIALDPLRDANCVDVWLTVGYTDAFENQYDAIDVRLTELVEAQIVEPW